jgi:hypothetical protein
MTVLKIAAGAFLGIFAILVLVKLPDFLKEGQNSHAQFAIGKLTPDELISRCGKPASEKRMTGERRLTYQGRTGAVTAIFIGSSKDGWNFGRAELGALPVGVWEKNGAAMILVQLPCMDTPKKVADSGH